MILKSFIYQYFIASSYKLPSVFNSEKAAQHTENPQ